MVANIELEKNYSFKLHSYDGPSSSIVVSRTRICSNFPYVWHGEPNQIKIAMSSDEYRPAKIYFIQLCAQQRHISSCMDAHSNQNLSCPLHIGFFMPNSNLRREHSGSVEECLNRDREAAGSSLTGVTALWSLSKTHLS